MNAKTYNETFNSTWDDAYKAGLEKAVEVALSIPCKWEAPITRPCCATTQAIIDEINRLITVSPPSPDAATQQ